MYVFRESVYHIVDIDEAQFMHFDLLSSRIEECKIKHREFRAIYNFGSYIIRGDYLVIYEDQRILLKCEPRVWLIQQIQLNWLDCDNLSNFVKNQGVVDIDVETKFLILMIDLFGHIKCRKIIIFNLSEQRFTLGQGHYVCLVNFNKLILSAVFDLVLVREIIVIFDNVRCLEHLLVVIVAPKRYNRLQELNTSSNRILQFHFDLTFAKAV